MSKCQQTSKGTHKISVQNFKCNSQCQQTCITKISTPQQMSSYDVKISVQCQKQNAEYQQTRC